MKVKELIAKLSLFSQEAEVYCLFPQENPLENNGADIDFVFELKGTEGRDGVYIKEE